MSDRPSHIQSCDITCHIGDLLESKEMSVRDLADASKVGERQVRRIVDGKSVPNLKRAFMLCGALKEPMERVFTARMRVKA
jgi:transcriptional regulator with XRE-family HTH domain